MVSILICSTNSNNYKKPAYDNGFYAKSHFVDNVCCSITNNETSRNCSISAPVRLTSRAKLLSQMNPIAGSMSVDSRSVEIQASVTIWTLGRIYPRLELTHSTSRCAPVAPRYWPDCEP